MFILSEPRQCQYSCLRARRYIAGLAVCLAVLFAGRAVLEAQADDTLGAVKRIYVDGFGTNPSTARVKKDLIAELRRTKAFQLASSEAAADATLTGNCQIYLKGYFSLNPRSGTLPTHGEAIYGGYLSVELRDRRGETVWSYLAAARSGSRDAAHELSQDVVKHLVSSVPEGSH